MTMPRLRLICLVFVIAYLAPGLSSIIPAYRRAYFQEPTEDQAFIPQRWRIVGSNSSPPEIEIQVLRGHVISENRGLNNEYRYSSGKYNGQAMDPSKWDNQVQPRGGEKPLEAVKDPEDNLVYPEKMVPQIGSRNIVTAPSFCPKGQRKDRQGRCKPIIS